MSEEEGKIIKLDGALGLGDRAYLTIITTDPVSGLKEVTYEVPYLIIDTKTLQKYLDINAIAGYKIEKQLTKDTPVMSFRMPKELE